MSLFPNLGDIINVPTLQSAVSNVAPNPASILNFNSQNFSLPGTGTLTNELASRLSSSGLTKSFESFSVKTPIPTAAATTQSSPSLLPSSSSGDKTVDLKVTIKQEPQVIGGPNQLVFTVMPHIDESGSAEYEQLAPLHHPGVIQKYRNSSARTWNVQGRLISRTQQEATDNLAIVNMIRAWRMPFYGAGTGTGSTAQYLGAPPPILTLSAYGSSMIGPVKCVLTSYSMPWDNVLDWIPTLQGNPFPVVLEISMTLVESWSPAEFSGFNLAKFKVGDLSADGAFKKVVAAAIPPTQATTPALAATSVAEPVNVRTTVKNLPKPPQIAQVQQQIASLPSNFGFDGTD